MYAPSWAKAPSILAFARHGEFQTLYMRTDHRAYSMGKPNGAKGSL